MATIGTFTQAGNGNFTGTIKTLTLNAKATLRSIDKESDKAPDYRLAVGTVDYAERVIMRSWVWEVAVICRFCGTRAPHNIETEAAASLSGGPR